MKEVRHSVCALDCPDCCSLLINVEDGKGSRLRGNPEHPVTRGFLCGKVARYLDRVYHPDRVLYPMKRVGAKGEGRFARVTWDEALDAIADRLKAIAKEHGPESVLPYSYGGTLGFLNGSGMDRRFFHRFGASQLDRTICATAGATALNRTLGFRYGTEPEAFAHSKLIIAWGANVLTTNVHLWPFIVEARRNGARFYVIDPVRNKTASLADKHFSIHPGTDLALALGLMHVFFSEGLDDKEYLNSYTTGSESLRDLARDYAPARTAELTGIPAEDILALAREYATTKPAAIRVNYGVQRSERGGAAVSAIAMLPAVTGSYRHHGGGLQLSTSQGHQVDRTSLERPDLQNLSPLGRAARIVNMSELASALTTLNDPPVKALVVYNSNPAAVAPDQNRVHAGLRRDDLFTVVLDQFQTDTADYADFLLPATTFLEHTDLYFAYGHYYLQLARPALPAPGEARSNVETFRALAHRLGFNEPEFNETEDDMIRGLLASGHPFVEGITLERLDKEHFVRLNIPSPFLPFAAPEHKLNLSGADIAYTPPVESRLGDKDLLQRYPLEFLTPKNHDSMNSTFGNREDVDAQTAVLYLDPSDAEPRGIRTGDLVRTFNDRGSLMLRAEVNGHARPGMVTSPSVRWAKRGNQGRNINALTSERLTDMGGGATFYSCLVQVEKCGD